MKKLYTAFATKHQVCKHLGASIRWGEISCLSSRQEQHPHRRQWPVRALMMLGFEVRSDFCISMMILTKDHLGWMHNNFLASHSDTLLVPGVRGAIIRDIFQIIAKASTAPDIWPN
ncbi:hypothetical protein CRM22_007207 [Opisthorchis felineus]|uniref:Uncharacterized protein n=1 Tax=Opisthorchis felineus TaxID=147828 RepID=A0A4S2LPP1_OPIFE|nr:hypothetical protein CRM22_007207 [Opisthorchis felineus]